MTGMIINVMTAEDTSPPTMGAAMRFMIWEPAPLPYITGKRPIRVVATVIILGRTLSTRPLQQLPRTDLMRCACGFPFFALIHLIQVHQHHNAGFRGKPCQGDKPHPHGHRHVVSQKIDQPEPPIREKGRLAITMTTSVRLPKMDIQQDEYHQQGGRNNKPQGFFAFSIYSYWPDHTREYPDGRSMFSSTSCRACFT